MCFGVLFGTAYARRGKRGKLTISVDVSTYDPPGDVSSTLLFEVSAKYSLSKVVSAELAVGWTQYSEDEDVVTLVPVQLNGEFHPLGRRMVDPYASAGFGAYLKQRGDAFSATAGIQAALGISVKAPGGFSLNVEVEYDLQDITDPSSGGLKLGGGMEGSIDIEL